MLTYSAINMAVTVGVIVAGGFGFLAGWLAHRALTRERRPSRPQYDDYYDV